MAIEANLKCLVGVAAAADLSTKQFYCVAVDSSGTIALGSAAGQFCIGILQNKPTTGQAATVAVSGTTKAVAKSAITKGVLVACTSEGKVDDASKAITDSSGASATAALVGSYVLGVALEAATADGDIITIELLHLGAVPTTAA